MLHNFFYKNRQFPAYFYFRRFNTVDRKQMGLYIKVCQLLDSNRGPLVLEATALPIEPQPLPYYSQLFLLSNASLPDGHRRIW